MTTLASAPPVLHDLQTSLRARLKAQDIELPLLSAAAQAVLSMTSDPNTGAKDLASKVSGDPALSAHLLRIANSPLYRAGFTLTSVRQAVGRLGMDLISQIAASVALRSSVLENQRFEAPLQALWDHSLRRGLCAREIARIRRDNIEQAFLGGLLRDLGQACVYRELDRLQDASANLCPESAKALAQNLAKEAGAALARKWELSEEISASMSTPFEIEHADAGRLTIELADTMAPALEQSPQTLQDLLVAQPHTQRLGLENTALAALSQSCERILASAKAMS